MAMSDQKRASVREVCDAALSAHDAHREAEAALERAKQHADNCRVTSTQRTAELRGHIGNVVVVHRGLLVTTPVGVDHLVVRKVESVEVLDAELPRPEPDVVPPAPPVLPPNVGEPGATVAEELVAGLTELSEQLDRGEEPKVLQTPVPGKGKKGKAKSAEDA